MPTASCPMQAIAASRQASLAGPLLPLQLVPTAQHQLVPQQSPATPTHNAAMQTDPEMRDVGSQSQVDTCGCSRWPIYVQNGTASTFRMPADLEKELHTLVSLSSLSSCSL